MGFWLSYMHISLTHPHTRPRMFPIFSPEIALLMCRYTWQNLQICAKYALKWLKCAIFAHIYLFFTLFWSIFLIFGAKLHLFALKLLSGFSSKDIGRLTVQSAQISLILNILCFISSQLLFFF